MLHRKGTFGGICMSVCAIEAEMCDFFYFRG